MLKINVICIGKIKEKFFVDSINEYSKRLSKYCNLNILELPDIKIPANSNTSIENEIKKKESLNILSHLKKESYIIALDLNGSELNSIELSNKLDNISLTYSSITFIIGGSLGLSSDILNQCNYKICFSKLTFPHQLIRIFLLEQIYRSFKISHNETYHK